MMREILITIEDFDRVDMRVGTVIRAQVNEKARVPAYCLWIDFGSKLGVLQSSAQLTALYTPQTLVGRRVIAVVNLPPRRVAGFSSQVLVLGTDSPAGTALLAPGDEAQNGDRVF